MGIIISADFSIFFRRVGQPPTSINMYQYLWVWWIWCSFCEVQAFRVQLKMLELDAQHMYMCISLYHENGELKRNGHRDLSTKNHWWCRMQAQLAELQTKWTQVLWLQRHKYPPFQRNANMSSFCRGVYYYNLWLLNMGVWLKLVAMLIGKMHYGIVMVFPTCSKTPISYCLQ